MLLHVMEVVGVRDVGPTLRMIRLNEFDTAYCLSHLEKAPLPLPLSLPLLPPPLEYPIVSHQGFQEGKAFNKELESEASS